MLLHGSSRYSDSFGAQRDSTHLLKKPKITKGFFKEAGKADDERYNLTRRVNRSSKLSLDELRSTDCQKSISGMSRSAHRIKPVYRSKERPEAEESAHGLQPQRR
jgi:hypothetical protein